MLKEFVQEIRNAIPMHANERKGFWVLMVICLFLVGAIQLQEIYWPVGDVPELLIEQKQVELAQKSTSTKSLAFQAKPAQQLFQFDPNTLDSAGWLKLGFSPKQTRSILKYRSKATFKSKKDVARLYVVSESRFAELEPFIQLPDVRRKVVSSGNSSNNKYSKESEPVKASEAVVFELNGASKEELLVLRGIGEKSAAQIISFRDLLGGFHSLDQLAEVYYLRDRPEVVEQILPSLTLDVASVRQIAVNTAEAGALADHPYIGWKQAKALVNYRNNHGPYKELEDIKDCKLISDELFRKIAPYLRLQ